MDGLDCRLIKTSRVIALSILVALGFGSGAVAHQLDGTETTLTIDGQELSLSIKTSEAALVRLLGEDQATPSELMHLFMQKFVIENASGTCTEVEQIEVAYNHDLIGTSVVRCDAVDLLTISTTLGLQPNTADVHIFKIILDGRMTVTMLPFQSDEIQLPVTRLRDAWEPHEHGL
ncbi:hypothetical protein L0664_18260 [Octadecabacter sp. G9-8]|uniref:Uncharacterized protein n=1 Tax=Octadecabacter dasysiphoniae TaxID=2909341 RepID=A0ABS9D0P7_9RHOB|nr:hypothetical protein [Octadecabacter dasysiphoniae]MCF2873013.1 hypothetical protein [Octadecabacter dasysiphoniae]